VQPIPDYDLTALNSLRLPSVAEYFSPYHSTEELLALLTLAQQKNWAVRVLGGGSNVRMLPRVSGLVIQSAMRSVRILPSSPNRCRVLVDGGLDWHQWVQLSVELGHGLENLALIPGSVGAAPVQNIGAYGVEVADYIEYLEGVQISGRQWRRLSADECRFSYRDSVFKHELNGDFVITRVGFNLPSDYAPNLSYGPLQDFSERLGRLPGSDELIEEVCRIRDSRLPRPENTPNAGSYFKNPIVDYHHWQRLLAKYPQMPSYPASVSSGIHSGNAIGQKRKLAAAWLIDQAGWKGKPMGPVSTHEKQALVLTTDGSASLADVLAYQQKLVAEVKQQFGVDLEPEPSMFGEK
jgi:UDP-N-acetylmuramate dehydrogenase